MLHGLLTLDLGGTQQSFIRGFSDVQPLTILFTFVTERVPLSYSLILLTNGTPFTLPSLELCISFNYCKCTVFLI